ncbi:MAG: response regulator [Geobacter sp.]|nr:response regulator [Geobacter sp.]
MSKPKVLLVDDVMLFLAIEKGFLELSPVQVLTAQNGLDALDIVKKERPDLVVMDVNMPKMDGITCCAAIKRDPELRAIPVIMITNASLKRDLESCFNAGCDDLIQKPVQGRIFLEKLRRFIPKIERREKRVQCRIEVQVKINGRIISGVGHDISQHGMYVASHSEVGEQSEVAVSFRLPANDQWLTEVKGRIAWTNRAGSIKKPQMPAGFGVEFLEVTGEGLVLLRTKELEAFIATVGKSM